MQGVLKSVNAEIDYWCFAGLEEVSRGLSVAQLVEHVPENILPLKFKSRHDLQDKLWENQCTMLTDTVLLAKTVEKSCQQVLSKINENDRIIIFGSFYTVAEAMKYFSDLNDDSVEFIN